MSRVINSPEFQDTVIVTRTLVTVDSNGLRQTTAQPQMSVRAVVTMNDDLNLLRKPEGERLQGSITLHSVFRFTDGRSDQGADADLVVYQGRTYTIISLGDWSRWGAGFTTAIARLTQINP
jgi:hypothetical protein